jgi:hypothetical protein
MATLSCEEARDLACDLLDGELPAETARLVEEHVAGCPSCPGLYRALVAVHGSSPGCVERNRRWTEEALHEKPGLGSALCQRGAAVGRGAKPIPGCRGGRPPSGPSARPGVRRGRNAIWLAERGWQVTGVDFSQVGLDKARRLAAGRGVEISLVHADLLDHQPAGGACDLAVVLYLQLPAVQRREVLRKTVAALARGGTLLVMGHDRLNLTEGHGGPRDPEVLFTPADIEHELPGLRIERAERVLHLLTVDGREVDAIDALIRARRPAGAPARSSVGQEAMPEAT